MGNDIAKFLFGFAAWNLDAASVNEVRLLPRTLLTSVKKIRRPHGFLI